MRKSYHTLAVMWQLDVDSPTEQGKIRYAVEPLQTEIIFPTGKSKTYSNWDVKGCREAHYRNEWVDVPAEELLKIMAANISIVIEYGVRPEDVRRFLMELAAKPINEDLFWQPVAEQIAQGASA